MKNYWSLDNELRRKLTAEQIREEYLPPERMAKGVQITIGDLNLELEPELPELPKQAMYEILAPPSYSYAWTDPKSEPTGIVFCSQESAAAFAADGFKMRVGSGEVKHLLSTELSVREVTVMTSLDYAAHEASLKEIEVIRQANKERKEAHEKALSDCDAADAGIWEDWGSLQTRERERQVIRETLAEYVKLCEGDEQMARKFLTKKHSPDEILDACGELAIEGIGEKKLA